MKRAYWFLILLTVECSSRDTLEHLPPFAGNSSLSEVWQPIQDIVREKDFSVVYSEGGGALVARGELTHKIFCVKDDLWQKIEIKRGLTQADTVNGTLDVIEKDLTLVKICSKQESKVFLDSLSHLGFFSLMDEKKLDNKCHESGGKLKTTHDAGSLYLYAIQGDNVRMISYYDLEQKFENCPKIAEINNLKNITQLFKKDWFSSRQFK